LFQIHHIERFTRTRIQRAKPPTLDQVEEARASVFLNKLRATLQGGKFKKQDHLVERLLEEGFTSTDIASALLHHLHGGEAAPVAPPTAEARAQRPPAPPRPPSASVEPPTPSARPAHKPFREHADRAPRFEKRHKHGEARPVTTPKHSRRTPDHQVRLYMSVGEEMGITPGHVVGAILGETGLKPEVVGTVDIRARHLFVDVATEHAPRIVSKLNRTRIKGHVLKVRAA
jgi:ATP-dependent RNA helicase DeaD